MIMILSNMVISVRNLNLKKVKKSLQVKKDSYPIPKADSSCHKVPLHNTNIKAKDERSVDLVILPVPQY